VGIKGGREKTAEGENLSPISIPDLGHRTFYHQVFKPSAGVVSKFGALFSGLIY